MLELQCGSESFLISFAALSQTVLGKLGRFESAKNSFSDTWWDVVGDVLADDGLVLQHLVQVLQLALRGSGKLAGIAGTGRGPPAGADVQFSRTEELLNLKK